MRIYLQKCENHFATHCSAMNAVGCCYRDGAGVSKDLEKAREWFTKALNNGCTQAKENLRLLGQK